jgi:hypothetical protein
MADVDNSKKCDCEENTPKCDNADCYTAGEPTKAQCKKCLCFHCIKASCLPNREKWRVNGK